MKAALVILGILALIGLVSFFYAICEAPIIDDYEDYLLKNEPNYLGQGRWIKE